MQEYKRRDLSMVVRRTFSRSQRRTAVRGRLTLRLSGRPTLMFRPGFLNRRDSVEIDLGDVRRTSCIWNQLVLTTDNDDWYWFEDATRLETLYSIIEDQRPAARRTRARVAEPRPPTPDQSQPHYWATGNYDPERYYRETRGWSREYRDYVRDSYGDLDTYESNRPD